MQPIRTKRVRHSGFILIKAQASNKTQEIYCPVTTHTSNLASSQNNSTAPAAQNDVSVIIPALNEASQISRAIQSAWHAGADEVIVVDGGSQDDTVAVAASQATVIHAERRGRAFQQNAGAEHATGQIFLFLHADCELNRHSLAEVRSRLKDNPKAVGGCFRQSIGASGWRYRALEIGNGWRAGLLGCPYGDQAIFVRSEIFESLGGFPEICLMEDLFFSRRLCKSGSLLLLDSRLQVSARRWRHRGVIRQTLRNWSLVTAALLGAPPDRLAKFYPNDR